LTVIQDSEHFHHHTWPYRGSWGDENVRNLVSLSTSWLQYQTRVQNTTTGKRNKGKGRIESLYYFLPLRTNLQLVKVKHFICKCPKHLRNSFWSLLLRIIETWWGRRKSELHPNLCLPSWKKRVMGCFILGDSQSPQCDVGLPESWKLQVISHTPQLGLSRVQFLSWL
jgi:hypothetical protein